MKKWEKTWLALFPLVLGSILGVFFFIMWPQDRGAKITEENADKIQPGMTRDKVIAILGIEPGNYLTKPETGFRLGFQLGGLNYDWKNAHRSRLVTEEWVGNQGRICVNFDANKVDFAGFYQIQTMELTPIERLFHLFGVDP